MTESLSAGEISKRWKGSFVTPSLKPGCVSDKALATESQSSEKGTKNKRLYQKWFNHPSSATTLYTHLPF